MSLVEAFHHLGDMDPFLVIRQGALLPPSLLYNLDQIGRALYDYVDTVDASDAVQEALRAIVKKRLAVIGRSQKKYGVRPPPSDADVDELDLIAGESEYVFFGPEWWTILGRPAKNGLILDAAALINAGAGIRMEDMNDDYRLAIEDASEADFRTPKKAEVSLIETLDRLRSPELFGAKALRFWKSEALLQEHMPELIFEGPVGLSEDVVLGVLRDGAEVPRAQWGRFS